ncbi:MAG: hypothetical protein B0D92_07880 [Spirochaeta sp. LUC14_002_19_P3]|nr:MAG: hypothetical protein B0D92_07880 [Spirochaeta sp. LUC14_002_19_P3]
MIVGIGMDIVSIERMKPWLNKPGLCSRYFHRNELNYAYARGSVAAQSLAARFAAKEAFLKALGAGFAGMRLSEIYVENTDSGTPHLVVEGNAKEKTIQMGVNRIHLSLTHEHNLAAAQVVLENTNG